MALSSILTNMFRKFNGGVAPKIHYKPINHIPTTFKPPPPIQPPNVGGGGLGGWHNIDRILQNLRNPRNSQQFQNITAKDDSHTTRNIIIVSGIVLGAVLLLR